MSFLNIDVAHVQQFTSNVLMMAQQKGSVLRDKVTIQTVTGERHYWELYDKTDGFTEVTTRHADINLNDTNFKRVAVDMVDYSDAIIVGGFDQAKLLIDPLSPVVSNLAMSAGRKIDDLIINSIFADMKTGKAGTTLEAPQTAIAVNSHAFGTGSGNANLTVSKVLEASALFDNANVDRDDRVMVVDPINYHKMIAIAEVTSNDFVSTKALETGVIPNLLGFTIIRHTGVPTVTGSPNTRRCFAFQKSGVGLAIGMDVKSDISIRKDKEGMPYQAYFALSMAATRLEGTKSVEIVCLAA